MITRRQFVAASAVALATVAAGANVAPAIIDPHFHVWNRRKLTASWLSKAGALLNRDYLPGDYAAAIAELNVRGAIYVEINVDPFLQGSEADMAVALCKSKIPPVVGAVVGGDPKQSHFAGYVDQLQTKAAIRGMRPTLPSKPATDSAVVKGLRRFGKLGLTVDLNAAGDSLAEMVDLIKACDETFFVIDHCGNAAPSWLDDTSKQPEFAQWRESMRKLAACPNAACKISGVAENGPAAKIESIRTVAQETIKLFGPDRAMFATNWPVCLKATTPARWFALVDDLARNESAENRAKLFGENAKRCYCLD